MITLNSLIYDILEISSSGATPNEFSITKEQVQYWIEQTRSMLISQSYAKKDEINDSWIQYLPCVKLEQVVDSSCCDGPDDCYILKSKLKIPSTIDTWKDNMIISVKTPSGVMIPKSNNFQAMYQGFLKYTNSKRSWYLRNDYLYIVNDQMLDYVDLAGLFETPSELSKFNCCDGTPCFTLDSPYPISMSLATQVTDIVVKTKVQPFMLFTRDTKEDGANLQEHQTK